MASVRTAELSWRMVEEARDQGAAVIVPMGSTEEHGPHSPTGDYLITDAIAEAVARETGDLVAPIIPFSYSEYFRHYPGTITVQAETLRLLLRDVVGSLLDQGFRRVILFNGHNGNGPILQTLIREFRRERGVLVPVVAPLGFAQSPALMRELYGDNPIGHGGEPVGSMMTYLRPELVDVGRAEDWGTQPFLGQTTAALSGITFQGHQVMLAVNMEDVTPPSGSLSDPRLASRERGERLVSHAIEDLIAFVRWFKTVDPSVRP
jgi:creatinine amidohydrolase